MLGSDILEVILGLAFLCVGLALVSSLLMESASLFLNRRGAFLHREIRELLKDDGLTKEFYRHPLVSSLYRGGYKEFSTFNLPPYIPARIFALALIDIAAGGGVVSGSWSALGITGVTAAPYPYGSYPPNSPYPIPPNPALRLNIEQNSVMNAEMRRALLTLVAAAADDPVRSRENIEQWFEAAMGSAADQYRRATLMLVMAISIALAAFINADALALARNLATGKSVRSALIALTTRNSDRSPSTQTPSSNTSDRNAPYPTTSPETSGNPSQPTPSSDTTASDIFAQVLNDRSDMQAFTLMDRLQQTAPPLGWDEPPQPGSRFWLVKISGILLTGLAVSMIAPLWFRLWKRFTTRQEADSRRLLADLEFIRSEFESIGGTHRAPPGT